MSSRGQTAGRRHEMINRNTKQVLKQHEKDNLPLVGVYNIKTGEIILHPCIRDRVWLVKDNKSKKYIKGWIIDNHFNHVKTLAQATIDEYNKKRHAPRLYSTIEFEDDYRSAHEYMLEEMHEKNNAASYRGFTVTLTSPITFDWTSGSLNSPRDKASRLKERIRGAKISEEVQTKVREKISTLIAEMDFEQKKQKFAGKFFQPATSVPLHITKSYGI